jgi:hypothetical protein
LEEMGMKHQENSNRWDLRFSDFEAITRCVGLVFWFQHVFDGLKFTSDLLRVVNFGVSSSRQELNCAICFIFTTTKHQQNMRISCFLS